MRLPWRRRYRPPPRDPASIYEVPGTGVTDLMDYLFRLLNALPPQMRTRARWVMDGWWLRHCDMLAARLGTPMRMGHLPPVLLGLPVTVREDGGWPHLEPLPRHAPGGGAGWGPLPTPAEVATADEVPPGGMPGA